MRPNKLRALWRDNRTIMNTWLTIPGAWTAELMAQAGPDAITIDLQHGLIDYETALSMLQAISTTDAVPLARPLWNDPGLIMRLLDAGAYGLICPMISTRADTEAFVRACRYPPQGYRSYGPTRANIYGGDDYFHHANDEIFAMAMIETAGAMQNLADISRTPGLDGLYVGPFDLSLSLGVSRLSDFSDPLLARALDSVLEACAANGLVPGIHATSPESGLMLAGRGFRFITVATDTDLLRSAAQAVTQRTRAGLEREPTPPAG